MKSIIAVMISSITIIMTIIFILGHTAYSQLDKELLGGGSKSVMFNKTKIDAATTDTITEDHGKRLKRSAAKGDEGLGSIEWWLRKSISGNDVNNAMVSDTTQDNKNIEQHVPFDIIGGDRSSGSDQFSTSTVATTTKYIDYDKLRWKWIVTGGMKRGPCGYFSYIRC